MSLATPHLIIMVGIPGSGKTFFAEHFATTFNAPYISTQSIAQQVSLSENDSVSMANYMLRELLKTNQTIVYDGDTSSRTRRTDLSKIAQENGYKPLFVWVQTESASAKQRATKKSADNRLTAEEFDGYLRKFTPPNASEKAIVISGKHTYPSQLKIILSRIASERPSIVEPRQSITDDRRRSITIR